VLQKGDASLFPVLLLNTALSVVS